MIHEDEEEEEEARGRDLKVNKPAEFSRKIKWNGGKRRRGR